MNKGLRITGLLTWIFTAIIIFSGGFIPLMYGMTMGFADSIMWLFRGVDGADLNPDYTGGGWLLILVVVAVLSAALVFALSIVTFFLSKKPFYVASTIMIVTNCVVLLLNALFQFLGAFWLNIQSHPVLQTGSHPLFYILPIVESIILIGMIVLAVFGIRSMKKEVDFQNLLERMKH